jgi:hypothetical protein
MSRTTASGRALRTRASNCSASPASPTPKTGEVLFEDGFDDDRNGWGVIDDPEFGSTAYEAGGYVWVFSGRVAHWIPGVLGEQYDRGELEMRDVIVRAEATIDKGDGVVGVACRETPDTDADWQWYEFVARDGFAAIRHADVESNIEVLAESKDVVLPSGEPFTIEGACVDNADGDVHLALILNGSPVLQTTAADPLGNGVPALQAWTHPMHEQMDVRWHEFSVYASAT